MKIIISFFLSLTVLSVAFASEIAPERSKGISMHMLPKRVADLSGQKWGFTVSYAKYLKPEKEEPILQTTKEFLTFVRKQDMNVQENGVWIVITNPDAYSNTEMKLLEDIKAICKKEQLPLFIARGAQLPNGWERYDKNP